MPRSVEILVTGLVQGVGFRPFIYLLAKKLDIRGWVRNTTAGVEIHAESSQETLRRFLEAIRAEAPEASRIEEITWHDVPFAGPASFEILHSEYREGLITGISPDLAVCDACLSDMKTQKHRHLYPFINCTRCGPRFTIIRDLPYDRAGTSMQPFEMCGNCRAEFTDPADRRFHAQPVACLVCGPEYTLISGREPIKGMAVILAEMKRLLETGKIIAIKGLGGFHLACDPFNPEAVARLRQNKSRARKPLAVMFRDMETLKRYAKVPVAAKKALESWRRPILVLDQKKRCLRDQVFLSVSPGLSTIGAFLPYMPLHYLLFETTGLEAFVLTSGNFSSDPVIRTDREALDGLSGIADAFLISNREIVNRCDDSVAGVADGKVRLFRRARGYVPGPVALKLDADNILALGGDLTAAFCLGKGANAILSQYIGDLENPSVNKVFRETIGNFLRIFRVRPSLLACDMHPGYFSRQVAREMGAVPLLEIQHHHAHIASVMAGHGLDEPVIGVAFDGTGYGTDGRSWGGEFLVCDLRSFRRLLHFGYVPLPGGDKAAEQPWRSAIAYLHQAFGKELPTLPIPHLTGAYADQIPLLTDMIGKGINCPESSSVGRLFDAVAAITGLCTEASYQAEAPMLLESLVSGSFPGTYSYELDQTIRVEQMIREIVHDQISGVPVSEIATRFHCTMAAIIVDAVTAISREEKIRKVALSGGVFQNRFLLKEAGKRLERAGFRVYSNEQVPANDGGIALGQLVIAAKSRGG